MKVRDLIKKLEQVNPNFFILMEGEDKELEVDDVEEDYRKQEVVIKRK